MTSARAGVDAVLVLAGVGTFIMYHTWMFKLRDRLRKDSNLHDYFGVGKLARMLWAQACMQSSAQGVLAIQTIRNALMAISFLATIVGILSTSGISILLDQDKMDRIRRLSNNDPISQHVHGEALAPPTVIFVISLGMLFTSFTCLAQSVRLNVHLGFMITAVSSNQDEHLVTKEEAIDVAVRAGVAFSIGLRAFYLFIVLILWCAGPTYVMIGGILLTVILHRLDNFRSIKYKLEPSKGKALKQADESKQDNMGGIGLAHVV